MNHDLMQLLAFTTSPVELVIRATVMYWLLILVFRYVLRRDLGALGVPDVLFIVIVADASQNGISGSYQSLSEAVVVVGTLVAWNYLLDYASYRSEFIRRIIEPPPVRLVRDGRVIARNLRREFITREELDIQLREAGVSSLSEVREAFLEGDGHFSVIRRDHELAATKPKAVPGAGG